MFAVSIEDTTFIMAELSQLKKRQRSRMDQQARIDRLDPKANKFWGTAAKAQVDEPVVEPEFQMRWNNEPGSKVSEEQLLRKFLPAPRDFPDYLSQTDAN